MRWKCQPFCFSGGIDRKDQDFFIYPKKHNLLGLFPILLSDVLWLGDWFWRIFKDWYHCGSFRVCTASRLLDHRGCFQLCSAVRFLSLIFPLDIWNVLCIILQYISLRSFCMKHEMDRYPMLHKIILLSLLIISGSSKWEHLTSMTSNDTPPWVMASAWVQYYFISHTFKIDIYLYNTQLTKPILLIQLLQTSLLTEGENLEACVCCTPWYAWGHEVKIHLWR